MKEYTERTMKLFPNVSDILTPEEGNKLILDSLNGNPHMPFSAGRAGSTETNGILHFLAKKPIPADMLCTFSGVNLPTQAEYQKFALHYIQCIKNIDLMGLWRQEENYYIQTGIVKNKKTLLRGIEPYYFESPWSAGLEGKKVLIIHPFVESMKKQMEKREKLWPNTNVLPEFDPLYLKSHQSLGDKDSNWFDNLNNMKDSMLKADYDVALIGCGAYGLPLASHAKNMGKKAIHVGGALQILFGIKGKRWDTHDIISKFYNEHWTRPLEEEKSKNFQMVEGGCYW